MVFVLSWIFFHRTNTIRLFYITLSIYIQYTSICFSTFLIIYLSIFIYIYIYIYLIIYTSIYLSYTGVSKRTPNNQSDEANKAKIYCKIRVLEVRSCTIYETWIYLSMYISINLNSKWAPVKEDPVHGAWSASSI